MAWGTRIFDLAAERQWSDVRLAKELGVNRTTLYRLRHGKQREVSATLMRKAHDLFGDDGKVLFWPLPDAESQRATECVG